MKATLVGWCFGALWFLALPAALVLVLVTWSDSAGAWAGELAEVVRDQRVPVAILVFTLAEMAAYHLRYRLPFANRVESLGPLGLPPDAREDFQVAQSFLEQSERALKRPIRAAAAVGLGRIGSAAAREALQRSAADKEPVVRNAVAKALRGGGA